MRNKQCHKKTISILGKLIAGWGGGKYENYTPGTTLFTMSNQYLPRYEIHNHTGIKRVPKSSVCTSEICMTLADKIKLYKHKNKMRYRLLI
jgi:hypothetical protein